jgi:Homeodomain-like domain
MTGKPNPRFIITERRERVIILLAQGMSECEIAAELKVGQSTICRDVKALNKESQEIIKTIEKEYYPLEFRSIINSLRLVLKKSWDIVNDESGNWTNKDKINAMKLIVDSGRTKFEILRNGPINLSVEQLRQKVEAFVEEQEIPTGFMPPILGPPNLEDLK